MIMHYINVLLIIIIIIITTTHLTDTTTNRTLSLYTVSSKN